MSKYIVIFILLMICKKDSRYPIFYQDIKLISNPSDKMVLVNKNNILPSSYVPSDLAILPLTVSNKNKYMVKEARDAFVKLSNAARKENYTIIAVSTYRDYMYQRNLYEYYVKSKGQHYADNCSARPGHSEHQTGLAVDVMGSNYDYDLFIEAKEYEWMKNNAHKYGFILRYPSGKEEITGFKFEPWHYRYVGIDMATLLYEKNITMEEYYENKNV